MTDFDKIVLSDNDLQYLESARYGAVLRLHPVVAGHLVKLGFLVPYALSKSDDEFVVTEDGMLYADYIDKKKNAERLLKEKEVAAITVVTPHRMAGVQYSHQGGRWLRI